MGMRKRYDKNGKLMGLHNMIFDSISDDYQMRKVILNDKFSDLSYVGIMRHLRDLKVSDEFADDKYYSSEVISHMAMDYIHSALYLHKGILADRNEEDVVSYYLIPCTYLCKHAIELKIKECYIIKGVKVPNSHSIAEIWRGLGETTMPHYQEVCDFISDVEKLDGSEIALRYGVLTSLKPVEEDFKFDIDNLILNSMFLFNVLDEHVVCKYKYGNTN